MRVKTVEIRDRNTFIPAAVIAVEAANEGQRYLLRRAGYGLDHPMVIVTRIAGGKGEATCDPYDWGSSTRTMITAHQWIEKHFEEITDGDVIDVEFILGETDEPKRSERFESFV